MLQIENIHVAYGDLPVLSDISLEIGAESIVVQQLKHIRMSEQKPSAISLRTMHRLVLPEIANRRVRVVLADERAHSKGR